MTQNRTAPLRPSDTAVPVGRSSIERALRSCGIVAVAAAIAVASPPTLARSTDLVPPTVTLKSPSPNATGISTLIDVRVGFSEPIQTGSASIVLRNSGNQVVEADVAYDADAGVATLHPHDELAGSQVYAIAVTGARDLAGNPMIPVGWSFTTATAGFRDVVLPQMGLVDPTVVQFAADGRVFVAERSGRLWAYDDLGDATPTLVADLRVSVYNYWDRGMLGMALHPDFPATPYIYVLYTHDAVPGGTAPHWGSASNPQLADPCPDPPGATANGCVVTGRLSRLNAGTPAAWPLDHTDEEPLVTDWFQQFPTHSIGALVFAPDGALYASAGDGANPNYADYGQTSSTPSVNGGGVLNDPPGEGGALRSQDLQTGGDPATLDGAIVRLDAESGLALPDTPRFANDTDPNGQRIVAHGLRNPFRFTFRPGTRELWLGDVGWTEWEEINRLVDPIDATVDNFGWPCYEGDYRQGGYEGLSLPICASLYAQGSSAVVTPYYVYSRYAKIVAGEVCPTGSSSITGLAFYPPTGGDYPGAYNGALFFADYSRNCIWAMLPGSNGLPDPARRVTIASGGGGPVGLIAGPGGDIFYPGLGDDRLHRLQYFSGNLPPTAALHASATSGLKPLTVEFSATGSSDPEGAALSYAWDLDGDGSFDDGGAAAVQWTYTDGGRVTARLRVSDPSGLTSVAAVAISVNSSAPTATIDAPTPNTAWKVGDRISFGGRGSDVDEPTGVLASSALSWDVIMHHCPSSCHTHNIETFVGVAAGSFVAPDHEYPSHLELRLTVTDSAGLASSASVLLYPQTVELAFDTSPSGLQLAVNSASAVTPFARTVIVGSTNSVSAPSPQVLGALHQFTAWSDDMPRTHQLTATAHASRHVATFTSGALSGIASTPSGTQDLAALGSSDWAHWGHSSTSRFTHKESALSQISDLTVVGNRAPSRYTNHPFGFTWINGVPTASATHSTTGLYVGGAGNGFHLTVPADPTWRTLTLFVGVRAARGRLVARLSDDSAPEYVDTSIAHAADVAVGRYDLTYRSPSAGQTLTVSFTASDESPGVVAVQAASLTIGQASASQTPTNLQASVAGQNVVLRWDAPHTGAPTVGYIVEAGSATGLRDLLVAPTGSTATTLSAAAPDGIYHVRVRAVTAAGVSEPSNEVVVQVGCAAAPDAVSQLDVEIAGDLVTLTWETSAGASGYVVQVGSATGLSNLAVIPVSAPALVTHAPPGTYFVRVAARNACGVSMLSNEVVVGVTSAR